MSYSRLDLSFINKLIKLIGFSKINKNHAADKILNNLNLLGVVPDSDTRGIVESYIDYLNSDRFTNLGRRAHLFLSKESLKEGVRFSNQTKKLNSVSKNPLFIIGLPRSGTTNLHNLVIDNLGYTGLRYWQLSSPTKRFKNITADQLFRKIRSSVGFYLYRYLVPSIQSMHRVNMNTYEECWHFQKNLFLCYNFVIQLRFIALEEYMLRADTSFIFRQYEKLLLQNTTSDQTFALKCPDHMMFLNRINMVFPQSKIIWIHRDPYDSIQSYCSMIDSVWRLFFGETNKQEVGDFIVNLFNRMTQKAMEDREHLNFDIIDVSYNNLISDRDKVTKELSEKIGIKDRDIKKRGKKSKFFESKYNKERDNYNLSKEQISRKFKFYTEHFSEYLK